RASGHETPHQAPSWHSPGVLRLHSVFGSYTIRSPGGFGMIPSIAISCLLRFRSRSRTVEGV
ncbi:MAG: hypothetical protein V3T86_08855, partial [Planctomycetota bacterium]